MRSSKTKNNKYSTALFVFIFHLIVKEENFHNGLMPFTVKLSANKWLKAPNEM